MVFTLRTFCYGLIPSVIVPSSTLQCWSSFILTWFFQNPSAFLFILHQYKMHMENTMQLTVFCFFFNYYYYFGANMRRMQLIFSLSLNVPLPMWRLITLFHFLSKCEPESELHSHFQESFPVLAQPLSQFSPMFHVNCALCFRLNCQCESLFFRSTWIWETVTFDQDCSATPLHTFNQI